MTFYGYIVGKRKFGAGDKKSALEEAKRTGLPVLRYRYKF